MANVLRAAALAFALAVTCSADVELQSGISIIKRHHYVLPSSLQVRQADTIDIDVNRCTQACDVDVCGPSSCVLARRSLYQSSYGFNDFASSHNESEPTLAKRVFTLKGRTQRYTPNNIRNYMVAQLTGEGAQYIDDQYPQMLGFFSDNPVVKRPDGTLTAGNSRAVSQSAAFGNTAFHWGSRGLHGCTMVAVISNRGAWMAHFWESYSNSDGEGVNHDNVDTVFRQRVLDAIVGRTVSNPINANTDPRNQYIEPEGPALDASLFNREEDETKIFIMTPLDGSVTTAKKKPPKPPTGPAMYPNKMSAIVDTINDHIDGMVEDAIQYNYWRLNYANAADADLIDKTERGMCMFQYDPNAFGDGKKGWRLFYEDKHYISEEGDVV